MLNFLLSVLEISLKEVTLFFMNLNFIPKDEQETNLLLHKSKKNFNHNIFPNFFKKNYL